MNNYRNDKMRNATWSYNYCNQSVKMINEDPHYKRPFEFGNHQYVRPGLEPPFSHHIGDYSVSPEKLCIFLNKEVGAGQSVCSCSGSSINNFNPFVCNKSLRNDSTKNFLRDKGMNGDTCESDPAKSDPKKTKRRQFSLPTSDEKNSILSEFADLTTSPDFQKLKRSSVPKTPLSGIKINSLPDGSSPYLNCFKYFSQSSPSGLIKPLEADVSKEKADSVYMKYKMGSIINDTSIWPPVWTCCGRCCRIQYTKDDFKGPILSLEDPYISDNDPHLRQFQNYWNIKNQYLVVQIDIMTQLLVKINICSVLHADRHAGHLNIVCPINHPFYVVDKGWCQVQAQSSLFRTLCKMDVISDIEDESVFNFSHIYNNQKLHEREKTIGGHYEGVATVNNNYIRNEFEGGIAAASRCPAIMTSACESNPNVNMNSIAGPVAHLNSQEPAYQGKYLNSNKYNNPMPTEPSLAGQFIGDAKKPGAAEVTEDRKRPMNGFMIFAKTMRLSLINENPGKDNRVISKILGEKWRQLRQEEKQIYTDQAKLISSERLKVNPFCWKRKNLTYKKRRRESGGHLTTDSYSNDSRNTFTPSPEPFGG